LVHELGHAILHDGFDGTREVAELEAESVAFIVCANLGIDTDDNTFGYVAVWSAAVTRLSPRSRPRALAFSGPLRSSWPRSRWPTVPRHDSGRYSPSKAVDCTYTLGACHDLQGS
jgi:hypothetical protein